MLEKAREASPLCYDPAMDEAMPEVAQRYFARAITRGTPLHRVVNLETAGSSIMIRAKMPMSERLILTRLGRDIVWHGVVGSRLMHFVRLGGCRAPAGGTVESGTMSWPRGVIPLARTGGTADHARDCHAAGRAPANVRTDDLLLDLACALPLPADRMACVEQQPCG